MSKKSVIFAAVFAFVCSVTIAGGVGTAVASDTGPAELILNKDGKKPARFPHRKHQEMLKDCGICHHSEDDGKQVPYKEGMKIQKCETCHNDTMANKKLDSFKKAAHERCKGCHKAKGKGPTKCSGCHIKK